MQADPTTASTLFQQFGPSLMVITVMSGVIKFFVIDKLSQITNGLSKHSDQIRDLELFRAETVGALRAKGCLDSPTCPYSSDDKAGGAQ